MNQPAYFVTVEPQGLTTIPIASYMEAMLFAIDKVKYFQRRGYAMTRTETMGNECIRWEGTHPGPSASSVSVVVTS